MYNYKVYAMCHRWNVESNRFEYLFIDTQKLIRNVYAAIYHGLRLFRFRRIIIENYLIFLLILILLLFFPMKEFYSINKTIIAMHIQATSE